MWELKYLSIHDKLARRKEVFNKKVTYGNPSGFGDENFIVMLRLNSSLDYSN
jgi:hypothetical protein